MEDEDDINDSASSVEEYDVNPIALVNTGVSSKSRKSVDSNATKLSNGFRKRVYSIGSWVRGDLTRTKSLGQYTDGEIEGDEDNELPLSLMRVVSKKSTIGK